MKTIEYIIVIILSIGSFNVYTQTVMLDSSFATSGHFSLLTSSPSFAKDIAIQKDGKILVAVESYTDEFQVYRLLSDGELDKNFGVNGLAEFEFGFNGCVSFTLLIQKDQKILVGGIAGRVQGETDFALIRLNEDGTLDTTFGNKGIVLTSIEKKATITDLLLQNDGKIIAAGYSKNDTDNDFCVVRYLKTGELDTTFSQKGVFIFENPNKNDEINSIAFQGDKNIIIGGNSSSLDFSDVDFLMIRLDSNGNQDLGFGEKGIVTSTSKKKTTLNCLIVQSDSSIIFTGEYGSFGRDIFVTKYTQNGELDLSYSNAGSLQLEINDREHYSNSIISIPNDEVLIGGYFLTYSGQDNFLVKLKNNGLLDTDFADSGIVTSSFTYRDYLYSMALQNDNKIVTVGHEKKDLDLFITATRYKITESSSILKEQSNDIAFKCYPNPVKNNINLDFYLKEKSKVNIFLTDIYGKKLNYLLNQQYLETGIHSFNFNIDENLPTGYYILTLLTNNTKNSVKIFKLN
jgi:uncharacterized delta-60 repeat protein